MMHEEHSLVRHFRCCRGTKELKEENEKYITITVQLLLLCPEVKKNRSDNVK